ncbi:kinase-like domain-containing protein [Mycena vitilis]|nr:kinase-like domain-containing protein [Mycena vitilis]
MSNMKQSMILKSLRDDEINNANQLQTLFESEYDDSTNVSEEAKKLHESNYRQKLSAVPRGHAVTVLNITHTILDGWQRHEEILNYQVFLRRAHHLLNLLAAQLELLPDKLAVKNVIVSSTHPIAYGGFSNIYRGRYHNVDGKEMDVALKVLRHFEDQPAKTRHRLRGKFAKEALAWFHLKHPNIVPFLGVDSTTFPNLGGAMVSPWMVRGSVLKYIAENSPVAPYAVEILNNVISGLNYLHSVNIVHGDLCGRNILINELGRASLTDFGLAGLIESEPTLGSSTQGARAGSPRWQSPELIAPPSGVSFRRTAASDVWAFGCVCGEIWTEGTSPFSRFTTDPKIALALSDPQQAATEKPYLTQPTDGLGTLMPDSLWDLVQRCWSYDGSERPTGSVIVEILATITDEELPGRRHEGEASSLSGSLGQREHTVWKSSSPRDAGPGSPNPPSSIPPGATGEDTVEKALPATPCDPPESLPNEVLSVTCSPATKEPTGQLDNQVPLVIIRFGPLDLGSQAQHEQVFSVIFKALQQLVGPDALREPKAIHPHGTQYMDLCFQSELEANSFAMTWAVHGTELDKECTAIAVKTNSDITLLGSSE